MANMGKVVQVIGSTLDAEFSQDKLPDIFNALEVHNPATGQKLVCEVEQHLGRNRIRAVAMSSTDGIVRGTEILDTGKAISVPVGVAALGRILNVLGEPVDGWGPIQTGATYSPIHREAPDFDQLID